MVAGAVGAGVVLAGLLAVSPLFQDEASPEVPGGIEAVPTPSLGSSASEPSEPDSGPAGTPQEEVPPSQPAELPFRGDGDLVAAPLAAEPSPESGGTVVTVTYSVEVEGGLPVDAEEFAATVQRVLTDARGWQAVEGVAFEQVPPGDDVDVPVTLTSPGLTDDLCAPLDTGGEVSCFNGVRVVLNAKRWVLGASTYAGDLSSYRTYLVNHEVGHGLDHRHARCPEPGVPAPVMVQQTTFLDGCTAWPWPTPPTP